MQAAVVLDANIRGHPFAWREPDMANGS